MPATSHSEGFVGVGSQVPGLIATGCHVTPIPAPISSQATTRARVDRGRESAPGPHSHATHPQRGDLAPGTIVFGDEVSNCVVVDLQGNVVVQEPSSTASGQYLVEEPILVRVNHGPGHTNSHHSTGDGMFGAVHLRGKDGYRDNRKEASVPTQTELPVTKFTNGAKVEPDVDPKWSFRPVLGKAEVEVAGGAEAGRPRRTSAKKARLRWKTIHEESAVKVGVRRARKINILRERSASRPDQTEEKPALLETPADMPVWARGLGYVRVEAEQWLVGIAETRTSLQDALEAHSRTLLCDYVRSHPSTLEQRHRLRDQQGRLMWQHRTITFHGTPFTITASHKLKCAFSMNYKVKRKENGNSINDQEKMEGAVKGKEGEPSCGSGGELGRRDGGAEGGREVVRKKYRSVTYTSCPAHIIIKDIVKYPGYAVSPNALSTERKSAMKSLRMDMKQGVEVEKEAVFHVTLPLPTVHNHLLVGRSRGIHQSVVGKVRELVSEGITAPKAIKDVLDKHIKTNHALDAVVPSLEDRAFYPNLKDIANLVYCHCRRMGITSKKRAAEQGTIDSAQRNNKRRKKLTKVECDMDERDLGCSEGGLGAVPIQASTLQEAVQTFCTDDADRASLGGLEGSRECMPSDTTVERETPQDASGLAEVVRGQLDTLRGLTYSLQEIPSLQELYQSLQVLISQYVAPGHTTLQEGVADTPATTAFILQDQLVDPITTSSAHSGSCLEESATAAEHIALPERDGNLEAPNKSRMATHGIVSTHNLRQLRTPMALQCMVPTLAVSQLPRTTSQNQPPHLVNSLHPTPITTPMPTGPPPPTYQQLGPMGQDGAPQAGPPVHFSVPPYFYYVQEVTVPEPGQSWTYSTTS